MYTFSWCITKIYFNHFVSSKHMESKRSKLIEILNKTAGYHNVELFWARVFSPYVLTILFYHDGSLYSLLILTGKMLIFNSCENTSICNFNGGKYMK